MGIKTFSRSIFDMLKLFFLTLAQFVSQKKMFMHDFLLILGMELFEEALIKWEQALNIRHQAHSTSSNNSLALQAATSEDLPVVIIVH